tara:strand:+ start:912 stop:1505 length:594 start_codon:yes stop_codon:yes gene_type:complete
MQIEEEVIGPLREVTGIRHGGTIKKDFLKSKTNILKFDTMKNIMTILLVLLFVGCKGQEKEKLQENEKKELSEKPKQEWEVHREFDEQGNLIRYDSVYRYAFPNAEGDSVRVNLDSIMNSFRGYFDYHAPYKWNDGLSYFPKSDSLFMKDFFKEDYFYDHWKRKPLDIKEMMRKMDSTRNSFLRKYHPGLLESHEND